MVAKLGIQKQKFDAVKIFNFDEGARLRRKETILSNDPVEGLDASILQNYLLKPILGIEDPRTDDRIDFKFERCSSVKINCLSAPSSLP